MGMRKEAIENASQAVAFDNDGNVEEAIKYYLKSANKLNQISKIDENKFNKDTYRKKALEYATRAKELTDKNGLGNTGESGSTTPSTPTSTSTIDKKDDSKKE